MGKGEKGKEERLAVPVMRKPMAYLCCVLNFIIPGSGTMLASFAVCCCSDNKDMDCGDKCASVLIQCCIGFLQLLLATTCCIGWIWSCVWGCLFCSESETYGQDHTRTGGAVINPHPRTVHPTVTVIHNSNTRPAHTRQPMPGYGHITIGYGHPGAAPGPPPPGIRHPPPAYQPGPQYPPPLPGPPPAYDTPPGPATYQPTGQDVHLPSSVS